jgi:hypothetical protein
MVSWAQELRQPAFVLAVQQTKAAIQALNSALTVGFL